MKAVASIGREDIAVLYILESERGRMIECVESIQPSIPRERKWVLLVSTLLGCPIRCLMCDAGGDYRGKLSKEEILAQIDFLVRKRFPTGYVTPRQWKVQFARVGEPTLNHAVLDALDELPYRYHAPGLMPSISTVAPAGTRAWFERLLEIKRRHYSKGKFQLQFSIHSTDRVLRDRVIPVRKWSFAEIAEYGDQFFAVGDRKITLNFALAQRMPVEPKVLLTYFDRDRFLIKITPVNPTHRAAENGVSSYIDACGPLEGYLIVDALRSAGYEVIVSIGEAEENLIGSNCGQYLRTHLAATKPVSNGYTYRVREHIA